MRDGDEHELTALDDDKHVFSGIEIYAVDADEILEPHTSC